MVILVGSPATATCRYAGRHARLSRLLSTTQDSWVAASNLRFPLLGAPHGSDLTACACCVARQRRICRVSAEVGLPRLTVKRFRWSRPSGAPGRIRTRDPLLRRHLRCVPGGGLTSPDVGSNCVNGGRQWLGVA